MAMFRYMVFTWTRTDRDSARVAKFLAAKLHEVSPHQWSQAWDGASLAIYHSGEHKGRMQTYRLQGERGAVLGRLFRNDYSSVVDDLNEFESRKCLETRGQHLVDDYWGHYVAFLNDPATGTRYVMRDPTGAFPCFHTEFRSVTIYFSDMQDAANFDFLPFTVNWEYVKTNIMLPMFQRTHTGLNEVREVLPAECLELTPFEKGSRFVWNPTEISKTDVVEDPEEAADLLRETVKSTIGALAGCYNRVIHNLGGLDSSIVLACMAQAPKRPEITCLNFFTRSPSGEERRYGRQVAEKYGVEFIEQELDWRKVDLNKIIHANKVAAPRGFFDCISLTGDELTLAKEKNAEALFYGTGGDNVYYQMPFNLGALDFVRRHGLFGSDALRVSMEASRYSRRSLAKTFREMLHETFAPRPCYKYVHDTLYETRKIPLANPTFVGRGGHEQFLHPLLIPDGRDLKGKYLHILCCALLPNEYYNILDSNYYAGRVRAYLTQPIIEVCLRIPVWVLTHGGVDRGLARKAFQNNLPQDVVRRFSKSTPEEYYNAIYDHNRKILREYLLDGMMVRKGALRRDKVEAALFKEDVLLNVIKFQTLSFFAMETWLRSWEERPAARPQNWRSQDRLTEINLSTL